LLSSLAAWRVSLQRMRADWPIVAAAWLITLLAATLLAAGPVYSDAVSLAGLRRTLADAPTIDVNIEITARVPADQVDLAGAEVERQVGSAMGSLPTDIERSAVSDTFALPDQPSGQVRDLAVLGFSDGIDAHTTLLEGEWPATSPEGAPIEVAVAEPVATELGWSVGDVLLLTNRADETRTIQIAVSGVFRADNVEDPFWWGETTTSGASESATFRTFGPLITTPQSLTTRVSTTDVRVSWHAFPRFDQIELGQVGGIQARAAQLVERMRNALAAYFPTASTRLDQILGDANRSLLVSRTGVLLLIVQLAILAAYAIVLTAGLLADHRRLDTALLRSRGAGPLQVASIALAEALVLALPAALLAPVVAAAVLRLFNVAGPLAAVQITLVPQLSTTAFVVAAGAALGAALLLVLPAFLAARSFAEEEGARSRFETRTMGQRLGLDIALLAVTAIGFWQLRLYGAPLTQSVHGSLGLDPLLVAAPAIGLLAGGVLALRVVPLLAQAAEAITRRGRRLVGALGAQQIARRPLRYTRAALLLMLAVSMGVFAISYAETWGRSQQDQADYRVGADVRVTAPGGAGNLPSWALHTAFSGIDGVTGVMPLDRQALRLPGSAPQGEVIGLDPAVAGNLVRLRSDVAGIPLGTALQPLADQRPAPALVTLDASTTQLRVDTHVDFSSLFESVFDRDSGQFVAEPREPEALPARGVVGAEVVLRDGDGGTHRFTASPIPLGDGEQQVIVPLDTGSERTDRSIAEVGGGFTGPLEVIAIDITVTLPQNWLAEEGRVELSGLAAGSGTTWSTVDIASAGGWHLWVIRNGGAPPTEAAGSQVDGSALVLNGQGNVAFLAGQRAGLRPAAVSFVAASLATLADATLPVVVNQALLDETSARVGDELIVRLDGLLRQLLVIGSVGSFPTEDPQKPLALADLSTLGLIRYASAQSTEQPDEWWLATAPGLGSTVAGQIDRQRYAQGPIVARDDVAEGLSTDPVALGIIGALSLGFIVAGLFAAIGLVVSASVSARQRRTEFALLRALGLSSGQLSGWLWLENAGIVVISLLAGVGLGLLIGWVALPFVTVTQQAAAPYPPAIVRTPWDSIGLLVAVAAGALGVTVLILARVLRRIGIGSVLRMGED